MRFLILLLLISSAASAQYTYIIQADSTKLRKSGGNNELIIENGTRATTGVLTNYGNGRTRFMKPRVVGDTLFVGVDTILLGFTPSGTSWLTTGNTGVGSGFLGTTDAVDVVFKRNTIEWLRRGTSDNTIFSNVPFAGAAQDSVWTSDGTGALRRVAQSDVNGGKNRLGFYLNLIETFLSLSPNVFGTTFMFVGNSWAIGTGLGAAAWSSIISTTLGKTKATTGTTGIELTNSYFLSKNLTNGNSRDSIWFVDCAYIPFFGMATSVSGLFGIGWYDSYSVSKTSNYIRSSFRSLMANYWLNTDTFSVSSLADANFRAAETSDSLGTKTAVGAIGLGAFQFTKPAGKTNIVIGTYEADGTRTNQGTIVVTLDGTEIYRKNHDSLNVANRSGVITGGSPIKAGLNYSPIVLMNLPTASSTIVVTALNDSTRFDYIGYLVEPSVANKPFYANNFPYGAGTPYFVIPRTNIDSGNMAMQEAVQEFSNYGYPAFINNVNQVLDSTNHLNDAHPSTAGNIVIANGYLNNLASLGYVPTAATAPGMTYPSAGIPISNGSAWSTSITNSSTVGQVLRVTGASTYGFGAVDLADGDAITGNLPVSNLNGGTSASSSTFWRGDGTWAAASGSGITTLAAIGSSPNANGGTISGSTYNHEPASASFGGVVTTGAQTFAGVKTFIASPLVTLTQDGQTSITITNASAGTNAQAIYATGNGTSIGNYGMTGTGYTTYGSLVGNTAYLYTNSAVGIHLMADNGTGVIKFSTGGNGEVARISASGALRLNTYGAGILTTDGSGNVTASPLALTGTASLNFDLTAVNSQDLTITVTGAASGDPVSLALDPASVPADITYFGWVSSANTVTVRCSRVGGGAAVDPASGSFTARVFK